MTRAITSNNYTATCADLICAYAKALAAEHAESDDADDLANAAVHLAEECGWDWEHDEDFTAWALKATGQEILVEGLQKALAAVRVQLDAWIARKETLDSCPEEASS